MATSVAISEAEILEALAAATGQDESGAKTANELAAEAGVPRKRIIAALHQLKADGRLVVRQVQREGIDGRLRPIAGYTVLLAKKRK